MVVKMKEDLSVIFVKIVYWVFYNKTKVFTFILFVVFVRIKMKVNKKINVVSVMFVMKFKI